MWSRNKTLNLKRIFKSCLQSSYKMKRSDMPVSLARGSVKDMIQTAILRGQNETKDYDQDVFGRLKSSNEIASKICEILEEIGVLDK